MDTYEGDPESPASLHKYLYVGADPIDQRDPSGQFSLTETNQVMATIMKLSSMATRVLRALDTAYSVADTVNSVIGIVNLLTDPSFSALLHEASQAAKTKFSVEDVVDSLQRNFGAILSRAAPPWAAWLALRGKHVKGLVLYMPNVGLSGKVPSFPTGLKIGRLPVRLSFGGTKKSGRIVGVGFYAPALGGGGDLQMWRVDYHPFHGTATTFKSGEDFAAWPDYPYHYHVLRPPS